MTNSNWLNSGRNSLAAVVCGICLILTQTTLFAQFDESAELPRGILARYTVGDRKVENLEEFISADWGNGLPDRRLGHSNQPFSARWESKLLIRQEGEHRFHVYAQGKVRVELAGKVVLDDQSNNPDWISGDAFTPDVGFQDLVVHFQKSGPEAQLRLYWSSEVFPLEPVPGHLFFRESGRPDLAQIELGRDQFAAFRCAACHQDVQPGSTPLNAPDLSRSVAGLSKNWIISKLNGHVDGKMPQFGLTSEQAEAIASALLSSAEHPKLDSLPEPGKGRNDDLDREAGLTLIRSLGCIACHSTEPVADSAAESRETANQSEDVLFGGGSLADIGAKRSVEWFHTWLKKPESLNRSHRMPIFELSNQERRQLALALASLTSDGNTANPINKDSSTVSDEIVQSGRRLINELGCRSCHVVPASLSESPAASKSPGLVKGNLPNWQNACIRDDSSDSKTLRQPVYRSLDPTAIRAYVESIPRDAASPGIAEHGRWLLRSRNCTACHPRGLRQGLAETAGAISETDPTLQGQAPSLVPPSLNAVGDRLVDNALAKAVSGDQKRRMDWKLVRMPRFRHSDAERQILVEYFINSDRIPDNAPTWNIDNNDSRVDDQTLLIGQELVGPKGFSCIACHQVGDYVPRKTIMGTRGSDLVGLPSRMRHSYFVRWTRSPLRIVPGVEMPSYTRPVHGVLGNDADAQLEVLWRTLADPRFEPPTDPASVEQYIFVEKDSPPRIIRDVFTNPEEHGGGHIPRAFAVGFGNGHNALLDLDNFTLRRWTFGDLGRQRTVGKSWYWDMAGSDIVTGLNADSNYALVRSDVDDASENRIAPQKSNGTVGQLLSYVSDDQKVRLRFSLNFEIENANHQVIIEETLSAVDNSPTERSGWTRRIEASGIPAGHDLIFSSSVDDTLIGNPVSIKARGSIREFIRLPVQHSATNLPLFIRLDCEAGRCRFTAEYLATLDRPKLSVTLKPLPSRDIHPIASAPGFEGVRLPLSPKIMPTAMTVLDDGTLAFTSLEGHVYLARDSDGDGVEDRLSVFEEGLSAPYGIIQDGDSLLVSHKPEIIRLRDTDGDGRADERTVFSSGWGFNDNYHDWTCGIVRDANGNLYVGLGSDYAQLKRPKEVSRWRGKVLQIAPDGTARPFAHAFRYPTGIAIDASGNVFATDNQGVQNTFNELNHLRDGFHFGVPKNHEQTLEVEAHPPAIQIPHPWTRSVNGITFLPEKFPYESLAGHGIGCEYNGKLLIRFTTQESDGILQGATYYLTKPDFPDADANFVGPLSVTTSPDGVIYIGSIFDSGWLGGQNTGSIVKLKPSGGLPNGIREILATRDGFEIHFQQPVDRTSAENPENYSLSGYTREWKGGYATPDSGRFQPTVERASLSVDGTAVRLKTSTLKTGFIYEINCRIKHDNRPLWPATGHFTLHRIPVEVGR